MLARILYAAVALSVLGAFPRAGADRAAPAEPSVRPAWAPRGGADRYCAPGDTHGIGRNTPDFAIPRIDR